MNKLVIDYDLLLSLDKNCVIEEKDRCEEEIESIVSNFWNGVGEIEDWIWPFFTTYLQYFLLRPLYIYYFSLKELKKNHGKILLNHSTVVVDIIAKHLQLELADNRQNHDYQFGLIRQYSFAEKREITFRNILKKVYYKLSLGLQSPRGVDVLYLEAGKMKNDFQKIPRAVNAKKIPMKRSKRISIDIDQIKNIIIQNINNLSLSIPNEIVVGLVEMRVIPYLPMLFRRIASYADYIEDHNVRLVIMSAALHEEQLALLAAGRMMNISTLVIGHGVSGGKNQFLDSYMMCQATLNKLEYHYEGVDHYPLRMEWFERKI